MAKGSQTISRTARKQAPLKIGLAESASISRVEGLVMSRDMVQTFRNFETSGASHEARRATLKNKYGKAKHITEWTSKPA